MTTHAIYALCIVFFLLALGVYAISAEPKLPAGYSCKAVHANVHKYGETLALAWARLNLTKAQIEQIRKVCRL